MSKRLIPVVLSIATFVVAAVLLQVAHGDKAQDDAIKLFKKYGCTECHAIAALELTVKKKEPGEEVEKKDKDEPDPPDLSDVGKERDAKWISNYLRKKEEIDGRKHEKIFKGSNEERRALATWLASLEHDTDAGTPAESDSSGESEESTESGDSEDEESSESGR